MLESHFDFVVITRKERHLQELKNVANVIGAQFHLIAGVAPMSEAFNQLKERGERKFILQVDEDMVLEPQKVLILQEAAKGLDERFYCASGQLYEPGFGYGGALKIWRRSFLERHNFADCRTVDREFHLRFSASNFKTRHFGLVVGEHRSRRSEQDLFIKTRSDVLKWRFIRSDTARRMVKRLEAGLSRESGYSSMRERYIVLSALILGLLSSWKTVMRSKDIRSEEELYELVKGCHFRSEEFDRTLQVITSQLESSEWFSVDSGRRELLEATLVALLGANNRDDLATMRGSIDYV